MCGISAIINTKNNNVPHIVKHVQVMNQLIAHRGPDGDNVWVNTEQSVAFGHRRLSIIDISTGAQPMSNNAGVTICYNGEVYNYKELKVQLQNVYQFTNNSDTEVILAAYMHWGKACVQHLRGMFAFVIYDDRTKTVFAARDRFGIKPFYYTLQNDIIYVASEPKALLPFLPQISTNTDALKDYLYFQLPLTQQTLFEQIIQLPQAHTITVHHGKIVIEQYWEIYYNHDWHHNPKYFEEQLHELLYDSIKVHTRSDVPVGAYVSGGIDSGIVSGIASKVNEAADGFMGFTGKFEYGELFDESAYAQAHCNYHKFPLQQISITASDFISSINEVIYHLDYPVAGPGSFPQYHVSKLAAQHRKVVLGGQGGDEIFGGYTRYLIAYFEQCIKGAIDNTLHNGNFVVTYESIIPNLVSLKNYKPLIQQFFKQGLFEDINNRYYQLINRAPDLHHEIKWHELGDYKPFESYLKIFTGNNVGKESYFDKMTHFDFKTLLPGLLQVEDRMSMAHSIESRVPFLDHKLVEFAATMPANIKFENGTLKKILMDTFSNELPVEVRERKNKMGFPVPLNDWLKTDLKEYINDVFNSSNAKTRFYLNTNAINEALANEKQFGRKIWGLLSLEIWQQQFHDKQQYYKNLLHH
jgi:asparagine synthase (glutamine-hydrolysing)